MKHKFFKGFLLGTVATVGAVVGSVVAFRQTVIAPVEEKADLIDENRRKALRKSRSAHQR